MSTFAKPVAGAFAFAFAAVCGASAQEVKQDVGTQDHEACQRDAGLAGDARQGRRRQRQLPAHQRRLQPAALPSRQADQHRQREEAARRLGVPDRRARVDGDLADRRERHHVSSRRRSAMSMRSTPRPASSSGTTSTRSGRSRPIAAARTIAASRSTRTRSISRRSMPSWSRSMPRPATRCGSPTSPIRSSATARRWRRPS